ncbi:MAG: lantibiotic dehydratase, partial [Micromonosporaceae bacterium]|nr:lantibiotic dehydratase [Micromonosporaceae bacterium]
MSTAHRFPLGTTGWSVWRDAILRGTGFPAGGLTELAAPGAAAAADNLLRTGRSAELFEKQFAEAVRHGARRITELAGEPLFREAVTWQNPNMLATLDHLVREGAEVPRTSRRAQRERAVLRYWQRYCGKNETVGFYGPICWVRLDPTQPAAVVASPGPGLTRRRWVVLESWALQAYGTVLARDLAVRRWWPPVRWPHLRLAGHQVLRPGRPPLPLTPVEAALLAGCDGRRPAAEVVADPAAGVRRPEDGYLLLDRLVERGVITWDAALPVNPTAEQVLRERIAAIGDPTAQAGARAGLERLCAARDAVAAATGDPDRLRVALSTMDEVFTGLTGQPPRHRDGQMYAGRTLCYLDSSRDLEVVFGAPLLEEISAPLGVLLQAARWLSTALREAYTAALRQLYDELLADAQPVALADLWLLAQAAFWGSGPRPVDAVAVEFARRWAGLFGLDPVAQWHPGPGMPSREVRRRDGGAPAEVRLRVAEIADRVAEVFPAGG